MAIAFDAITNTAFAVSTKTESHTTSGTNRYLFIHLYVGTSATPTTITYAGVTLSLLETFAMTGAAAGQYIRTYGLVNPASGANNAVITFPGSPGFYASIVSYTGANQTSSINTSANNGSSSTSSLTTTVTTTVDNCWLIGYAYTGNTMSAGTGTTLRGGSVAGILNAIDSNSATTPAGSDSLIVTQTAAFAGMVIVALAPALDTTIKTYLGTATANVKTVLNGTAIASRKTWNGIA